MLRPADGLWVPAGRRSIRSRRGHPSEYRYAARWIRRPRRTQTARALGALGAAAGDRRLPRRRRGRPAQVIRQPGHDPVQPLDAVAGLTDPREIMALIRETHEYRLAPQLLEGGKQLLGLLDRAAQVLLTVQDQQRRGDPLDVRQGGEIPAPGRGFPRVAGEFPESFQ